MEKHDKAFGSAMKKSYMSYNKIIIAFILMCLTGLTIITTMFNSRIEQHDKELTYEICTLISDKMDNSIKYMTDSVRNASAMMSGMPIKQNPEGMYENIRIGLMRTNILSVGFIDGNGDIYGEEAEKEEFNKLRMVEIPENGRGTTISEPYRSSKTGMPVFTVFADISYMNNKLGTLFMTYPLSEIQKMANTESMGDDTEVWLMDGRSDNFIRCSGTDNVLGGWSNFKLYKNSIKNKNDYANWERAMRKGDLSAAVNYELDNTVFTQVFKRIDYMPGWNVVVRMPSHSLTETIKPILAAIVIFALAIIAAALIMIHFFHRKENAEKQVFERLSTYDPLTHILNRRAFDFDVKEHFAGEKPGRCTFMFLDIDYFKQVNDRFGHEAGDKILIDFSERLSNIFGQYGTTARYGGDEFVVLVKDKTADEVNDMIQRFKYELNTADLGITDEDEEPFHTHFSAGLAVYPDDADEFSALLRCADEALYKVKESGRNSYQWYKKEYNK